MPPYRDPVTGKFAPRPAEGLTPTFIVMDEAHTFVGPSMSERFRRLVQRASIAPPTDAQRRAVATRRAANKVARKSRKVNR